MAESVERNRIKIFDTTLRDGQQCPGAGMSAEENLSYALLSHKLGCDVIELGFASASQFDFDNVQTIASVLSQKENPPVMTSLSQLREEHIDLTLKALEPALEVGKARLHTYLPVDPNLSKASLGCSIEDIERFFPLADKLIRKAMNAGFEVQFSPEGFSRADFSSDYVLDLIRVAVDAGAGVINCPDTIGGANPWAHHRYSFVDNMQAYADIIKREYPKKQIEWSCHCHNDYGLAVTNSIEAVFNGPCTQVEGCINGVGERGGNAAIEQVALIIHDFGKEHPKKLSTQLNLSVLGAISDFVSDRMLKRSEYAPVVGENACTHTSGGHTNAILKDPTSYQPYEPNIVGKEVRLVFGPFSGGNHAKAIIEKHGFKVSDSEKADLAQFIKNKHPNRRKGISDPEVMEAYHAYKANSEEPLVERQVAK